MTHLGERSFRISELGVSIPFHSELHTQHCVAFLGLNKTIHQANEIMSNQESWIEGEKFLVKKGKREFFVFLFKERTMLKRSLITIVSFDMFGEKHYTCQNAKDFSLQELIESLEKTMILKEESVFIAGKIFQQKEMPESWASHENITEFLSWYRKEFCCGSLETNQTNESKLSINV